MSSAVRRLPEEQLREFKMAFACFDIDGDGEISRKELKQMMERLGEQGVDAEASDMINVVNPVGAVCLSHMHTYITNVCNIS